MKKISLATTLVVFMGFITASADVSLQDVFDLADGYGQYDKYIELDPDETYIGDLDIPPTLRVYLDGNGALIIGRSYNTSINVFGSVLDLSNCVIVGGYLGVNYDTLAAGVIHSNTIVGCQYAGLSVMYQNTNEGVEVWDNIITDCVIGFICIEDMIPVYVGHNTVYGMEMYRYAELCPD